MSTEATTVTFAVEDMTCGNCVKHVGEAIAEHAAGAKHDVDLAAKRVTVTFDPQATTPAAIAQALDEAGYPARVL
jgi:copper chaperone CopZ